MRMVCRDNAANAASSSDFRGTSFINRLRGPDKMFCSQVSRSSADMFDLLKGKVGPVLTKLKEA